MYSIVSISLVYNINFKLLEHSYPKILSHPILHFKKSLYQLYYTILQYSQYPNFYFTIRYIKIIFLHNKIIYLKTQIKTKTQITSATTCYHYHHHHEKHTQTNFHLQNSVPKLIFISKTQYRNPWPRHHHHHDNPPPSPPWTHIWPIIKTPPPYTTITATFNSTTMNP